MERLAQPGKPSWRMDERMMARLKGLATKSIGTSGNRTVAFGIDRTDRYGSCTRLRGFDIRDQVVAEAIRQMDINKYSIEMGALKCGSTLLQAMGNGAFGSRASQDIGEKQAYLRLIVHKKDVLEPGRRHARSQPPSYSVPCWGIRAGTLHIRQFHALHGKACLARVDPETMANHRDKGSLLE